VTQLAHTLTRTVPGHSCADWGLVSGAESEVECKGLTTLAGVAWRGRALITMLQSPSAAVSYEAAWTLVSLSSAQTAVRAAARTFAQLLNSQSDNNVKLIILERLSDLKARHTRVVQEVLMDIMRALSSPNVDICRKTLDVAMDLVSPRNIDEVVLLLKREVMRTQVRLGASS
jgi:vesicle coat complex subunit